jgi:hypothetical protein
MNGNALAEPISHYLFANKELPQGKRRISMKKKSKLKANGRRQMLHA